MLDSHKLERAAEQIDEARLLVLELERLTTHFSDGAHDGASTEALADTAKRALIALTQASTLLSAASELRIAVHPLNRGREETRRSE
jgi:hypothetical protein